MLAGCVNTPVNIIEKNVMHPSWPTPYKVCQVEWKVREVEGEPYVGLSYNDNVSLASCGVDVERLISQYNQMVCSYRRNLKEERCALYNKKDKNEQ